MRPHLFSMLFGTTFAGEPRSVKGYPIVPFLREARRVGFDQRRISACQEELRLVLWLEESRSCMGLPSLPLERYVYVYRPGGLLLCTTKSN
ncbi:hypothetical protein GQ53DRAFT_521566 [Thozetella sp. PMI_491]|nr:hypothetical protein GQ53DRAFT_521566 [Thozetella sp. PMI_491]